MRRGGRRAAPLTCEAIVPPTAARDVGEEDQVASWLGDADAAQARERVGTARPVLAYPLRVFPDRRDPWRRPAEKTHRTCERLNELLACAVELTSAGGGAVAHVGKGEIVWRRRARCAPSPPASIREEFGERVDLARSRQAGSGKWGFGA